MFVWMLGIMLLSLILFGIFGNLIYYFCTFCFVLLVFLIKKKQKFEFIFLELLIFSAFLVVFIISIIKQNAVILKIIILLSENFLTFYILMPKKR